MKNTNENVIFVYADKHIDEDAMQETIELIHACDMQMDRYFTQRLASITFATYIGKGKVEEIRQYMETIVCDCVIFQQDLTPLQLANLETLWDIAVMTRSDLIVKIFAKRAQSQAAKLQVESARLKKLLPRLIGTNTSLGRQSGGRNKGKGEKQLEIDRRRTKGQIQELEKQLKQLKGTRVVQRRQRHRSDMKQVALVGYTNAGKSTIMNALLASSVNTRGVPVIEEDMLFATLDTSVRKINMMHQPSFLLFDTVGFVSNLPHELVKAFHSTLEEVCYADLLIQVIDTSSEHFQTQMEVTGSTLHSIRADHIPMIKVFNKCDHTNLDYPKTTMEGIYISAKEAPSIAFLLETIQKTLYGEQILVNLAIPYEKTAIIADLRQESTVIKQENKAKHTIFQVKIGKELLTKYRNYVKF